MEGDVGKDCKASEAIPGMPQDIQNTLGDVVEVIAEAKMFDHYCRNQSVNEFTTIFPKRGHDGTQLFRMLPD
jgi:hypothetical protein